MLASEHCILGFSSPIDVVLEMNVLTVAGGPPFLAAARVFFTEGRARMRAGLSRRERRWLICIVNVIW